MFSLLKENIDSIAFQVEEKVRDFYYDYLDVKKFQKSIKEKFTLIEEHTVHLAGYIGLIALIMWGLSFVININSTIALYIGLMSVGIVALVAVSLFVIQAAVYLYKVLLWTRFALSVVFDRVIFYPFYVLLTKNEVR